MKSTTAICALGVAAAGHLGAWARAPDDMQTMDSILNMDSVGDISTTSGSPLLDVGNSVIDELSSFLSGLPSQLNTWWTADPTRANSVDSQAYENASQRVTDALNELSQFAGVPATSYDDFTQSVFCDIVDSLNIMVDTGLADIGFDMLPYTVDNFDMSKFMGKWYQTYAGQFVIASVESNMACIESEYTQSGDSSFDLKDLWVNPQSTAQTQQDSEGESTTTTAGSRTGTATETSSARFRVSYNEESAQRCLSHGYWVLGTGPVVDGKYDWAIVSDPFNIAVRVLARDPEKFKNEYEATVLPSFRNSFPGLLHTFTPIDQSNCPARDKAAVVPVVPVPAPPATKTVVVTMTTTTAVPMATTTTAAVTAVPLPPTDANANSEAAFGSPQPSPTPENESNDDNDNTALAIALGVGLGLLALILLALLLFFCCYRRRRAQKAVAVAPAKKTVTPGSDEALLKKGSKTCAYCQGAQCVYGGQQEHDLARKLEHVDYAAVGNVTSADISTAAQSA